MNAFPKSISVMPGGYIDFSRAGSEMHEFLQLHKAIKNRSCKKCNWQAINGHALRLFLKPNEGKKLQ
jgi:RNase P subunit RPR2